MTEAKPPDPSQDWGAIDIFLFSNGQEYSPPRKYHLTADELNWWDKTLSHLARTQYGGEKMHKTVELYTLNGKKVQSPIELRDGVTYVAVSPNEKFFQAGYEQYLIKASRSREKRERRKAAGLDEEGSDEESAAGPSANTYRRVDSVVPTSSCHSRSVEPSANECRPMDPSLYNSNPGHHHVTGSCCSCSAAADATIYNNIDSRQGQRSEPALQMCSALPTECCSDFPSIDCPKPVVHAQKQGVQAQNSPAMLVIKITEIVSYNEDPRRRPVVSNAGTERRKMTDVDPGREFAPNTVPERRQMPNLDSEIRPVTNATPDGRPTCNPCHCPPMMEPPVRTNDPGRRDVANEDGTEWVLCSPCNDPMMTQGIRSNEVPKRQPISAHDPRIQSPPRTNDDAAEWVLCSPCNDPTMLSTYKPMNLDVPDRRIMASNDPRWPQMANEFDSPAAYDSRARQIPTHERDNRTMDTNERPTMEIYNGNPERSIETAVTPRSGNMTNADPAIVPRATSAWTSSDDAPVVTHSSLADESDMNCKERLLSETCDTKSSQNIAPSRPQQVGVVIKDVSDDEMRYYDIHDSLLDLDLDNDDGDLSEEFSEEKLPAPEKSGK